MHSVVEVVRDEDMADFVCTQAMGGEGVFSTTLSIVLIPNSVVLIQRHNLTSNIITNIQERVLLKVVGLDVGVDVNVEFTTKVTHTYVAFY